jgi:hypothetical protein
MSNAIQLRDASDVTTFKKQKALYRNFTILQGKDQVPLGGISHTDLMGYARTRATYIPADSLVATVTAQADCPACVNSVEYSTTAIVAPVCVSGCASGGSYAPNYYQTFQASAVKKVAYS